MNGFRRLQERLYKEGWYVGWNHYCCQSCAWNDVPYEFEHGPYAGTEIDLSKVLFNHSQDCEYDWHEVVYQHFGDDEQGANDFFDAIDMAQCAEEDGEEGAVRKVYQEFDVEFILDDMPDGMLYEGSFICFPPELQNSSLFCFDGGQQGLRNLIDILPIIEQCGCKWNWNKTANQRIEISWELE